MGKPPFPLRAFFASRLEVTYAIVAEHLAGLPAPGLELETHEGHGFITVALTQARALRPAFLPRCLGIAPFFLSYHVLVRHREGGRSIRGLQPLRRLTNHRAALFFGNLWSPTPYQFATMETSQDAITTSFTVRRAGHQEMRAITCTDYAVAVPLPPESPFADWAQARRLVGPQPLRFTPLPRDRGVLRSGQTVDPGEPEPVQLLDLRVRYIESPMWKGTPRLAAAFITENGEVYRSHEGMIAPAGALPG